MPTALEYLDRLLVARLRAVEAMTTSFAAGYVQPPRVLNLPRLILVRAGTVDYRLDDRQWTLRADDVVLVPALCRRSWTARGDEPLTLSWLQFSADPAPPELPTLLRTRSADPNLDMLAIERVGQIVATHVDGQSLEAEGEMKAILARFLVRATASEATNDRNDGSPSRPHRAAELAVAEAARWLATHFGQADPLTKALQRSRLSGNHFRLVFKRQLGMSPQRYLAQVRMRAARFRLHETQETVKEVAKHVGYADPFHFSRAYRAFWGQSPANDRTYAP